MIAGEEVMLKDQSVFKTSTGDEAATKSQGMGVVTHTIQGEASFTAWSMDVKFEGANVDRHLDLMKMNEQSDPPNPPPWAYTSSQTAPEDGDDGCKPPSRPMRSHWCMDPAQRVRCASVPTNWEANC